MESVNKLYTCAQVNEMDLVNYLHSLGFQPVKIKGLNYWYHSPLRSEHTPSFKVNRALNRWYDFGIGKGGTLVDFAIRFYNCSVKEFLVNFENSGLTTYVAETSIALSESRIEVTATKTLHSPVLIKYLASRRIEFDLAAKFCQQVHFNLNGKSYFGIGFQNDYGGYEIRNPFFKSSSSPKGITTFKNGYENLSVFEGFFDFLSFLKLFNGTVALQTDYLILNSLSFFEKHLENMQIYRTIFLYLDNDPAAKNCITLAGNNGSVFVNRNQLYRNYKDLNDMLVGKPFPKV